MTRGPSRYRSARTPGRHAGRLLSTPLLTVCFAAAGCFPGATQDSDWRPALELNSNSPAAGTSESSTVQRGAGGVPCEMVVLAQMQPDSVRANRWVLWLGVLLLDATSRGVEADGPLAVYVHVDQAPSSRSVHPADTPSEAPALRRNYRVDELSSHRKPNTLGVWYSLSLDLPEGVESSETLTMVCIQSGPGSRRLVHRQQLPTTAPRGRWEREQRRSVPPADPRAEVSR